MTPTPTPCRGCGALIVFIKMKESGRTMPCDAAVIVERLDEAAGKAASTVTLVTDDGVMVIGRRLEEPHVGMTVRVVSGRVPHFVTCPFANTFRRK